MSRREASLSQRVVSAVRAAGLLALVAVVVALVAPSSALASSSLVFSSADLTALGLRPAPTSVASARSRLVAGLPGGVGAALDGAVIQASAGSGGGQALGSYAFVLRSTSAAGRVLTSWRSAHHAKAVAIGAGGAVAVQASRERTLVQVLWRDGARLGLVVLNATSKTSTASSTAVAYAMLAESYLTTALPTTAWAKVLDQIRPDGTVPKATALQAFALAYGPLPGVRVRSGTRTVVESGGLVAQWVLSYRSQLTGAQLRAVDRALGLPAAGTSARAADLGDPGFHQTPAVQATAEMWSSMYASLLQHPLGLKIVAGDTSTPVGAYADALPLNANGGYGTGDPTTCRIRVPPAGQNMDTTIGPGALAVTLAHEVFHCYQFDLRGANAWTPLPAWIGEGTADWAARIVDPTPYSIDGGSTTLYIQTPDTQLFTRAYDAVGFWGHVQDTFGDLWARLPAIFNAGNNVNAFHNAVPYPAPFLDSWGSSVFRLDEGGPPWEMLSPQVPPGPTDVKVKGDVLDLANGYGEVLAAPYTTAQYVVHGDPAAPLVLVKIDGSARMSTKYNYTFLGNAWFCTADSPDGCMCPKGTTGKTPASQPLETDFALGLGGEPGTGTVGSLQTYSLSQFCHGKSQQPGGGGGGSMGCRSGGCASSSGDPHLLTFAGDYYDFQAAGEFTLLKATTDDLEIQERQQPFPRSRELAINTAVAMRVAGAIVEVDAGGSTGSLVLWVNKRRVQAPRSLRLSGGGLLSAGGATVTVSWPDGTQAQLFSAIALNLSTAQSANSLDVAVKVAPGRSGHLTGLLGDAGAASGTEFVGRDGRRYSTDVARGDSPANFKLLYGSFGQSWRISQRDSLFVYPRGKDTSSYTITGFPSIPENVLSLSPGEFGAGERACTTAGVTDPAVLGNCILDVGATGDPGFAAGAVHLQGVTGGLPASAGGVSPVGWTELSSAPDTDTLLTPSLAPAGASIVAAFRAGSGSSIGTATFTPTAAGIGAVTRSSPFTGWSSISDPLLFPASGGGVQMIFGGLNNSSALSGTLIAQRQPDGTFGQPSNTASGPESNLARGAVLAGDGITPVWTATYGPYLKLERGGGSPVETDLSSLVPGAAYVPTLAHDRSGRLWMAWREIANNPAQSGLYLLQLDPSGDGVAPGATPLLAPASQASDNLPAQPALACAAACRLVYEDTGTNTQLDSWAPGEAGPTAIASDSQGFSGPTAAYTADGRLWVAWSEPHSSRMLAKLGDATGAGGSPILTLTPPGYSTALNTASTVAGTQLLLATNWQTDSHTSTTAVFATVINAG